MKILKRNVSINDIASKVGEQIAINAGNASLVARAVGGISAGSPEIVRSVLTMLKIT